MLYEFLEKNRIEILALTEEKTIKLAGSLPSSAQLRAGLPLFFDHLIEYLKSPHLGNSEKNILTQAAIHGKELLKLNYTISHVVHAYGAMCQAITEYAQRNNSNISTQEFNDLNLCLDIAIASSVSEFQYQNVKIKEEKEVQHLGFLVHELRNALSSATMAQEMIKNGIVGSRGSTARVLEESLTRMRKLMDSSLSEVRMRSDPTIHVEKFQLNFLIDQLLVTSLSEAKTKNQTIKTNIQEELYIETDRQLLLSAIANLLQNALKYSKVNGSITLQAASSSENVVIEVEDECGGIPSKIIDSLFKPFNTGGEELSGLGLGLTIVKRAVSLLHGKISVTNTPGSGCIFMMVIPKKLIIDTTNTVVSGESSVQPMAPKPAK
ncbi:MAG: HAMP domain-containing histidine kinase [Deltaproteobacteria bacterium]|jgi:signal transduction histidine kinase|nr:HAMP domain-containing histidine kinase [Deltaproteobacteria bacterium]